jgi:hypothetical protein
MRHSIGLYQIFSAESAEYTKHMSIDVCPKWNSIQDILQRSCGWEGEYCLENDIFGATFKERQSQNFVFKTPSPALRLISIVLKNPCQKSGGL